MMTAEQFSQWVAHPEQLNRDTLYELRTQVARYPYVAPLRLLLLRNLYLLRDDTFGAELRNAALCVPDRSVLFYLVEGEHYRFATDAAVEDPAVQPDDEGKDRTESLINAFLSTLPDTEPEDSLTANYDTDYATYLLHMPESTPDADAQPLKGEELIDNYIAKVESGTAILPTTHEEVPDLPDSPPNNHGGVAVPDTDSDTCFTETLAKIYIRQQKYTKALEIIKKLHLKYPKKNAYFADQIRFLEKLIINANSK